MERLNSVANTKLVFKQCEEEADIHDLDLS